MIGTKIAHYEINSHLGTGGMGEVYQATDSKLGRSVAIKLLPAAFASDADRLTRFRYEAQVLASLNHPNIAHIYGLEESGDMRCIVMELVEGETLQARIQRGPIPVDEALTIAKQIAEALEAAHEKGVIHRDLKPGNVMMAADGRVKVLDFGLAKVSDTNPSSGTSSNSPTMASMAATNAGVILGTASYMSPEQARGKVVDKRTDIWAFGVVLYEMLTGEQPFHHRTIQETLAAVLTTDPDWQRIPPALRPLLRGCLARDPPRRMRDIGDYRFLIEPPSVADTPRVQRPWVSLPGLAGVVLAVGAVIFGVAGWLRPRPESAGELVRLTTVLPPGVSVTRGPGITSSVAVSPDGRTLVVAGTSKEGQRLYRRPLEQLEATPLAGTERGSSPFFSWDGASVGFFADGKLKRVPAGGGVAVDIAPTPGFVAGASWGPDNRIIFGDGASARLHIVDADDGKVGLLSEVELGLLPEILPDGKTVLFESNGWVHAFNLETKRKTQLVQGTAPRYAFGHVILNRGTNLLAASLDLSRLELTGAVFALVEGVATELPGSGGGRHYAVSQNGSLAYVPAPDAYALVIVGANGVERLVTNPQRSFENPRFSPDGRHVVVAATHRDGEPADLWMHDIQTGTETRLTFDGGRAPVWSPDGTSITYSHLGEKSGIYSKRVDGLGDSTQILPLSTFHWLVGWTPDRSVLGYGIMDKTSSSIMSHSDNQSRRVVGMGSTWGGRLSRDGRWLAYYWLESGTFEVYVTPFPDGGPRWLVAEGTDPAWSPDGTEVYYRSGPRLMAARIDRTAGIRVLAHRLVIEPFLPPLYDDYDVHSDGRTLVMVRPANTVHGRQVTMVLNGLQQLKERVPTK